MMVKLWMVDDNPHWEMYDHCTNLRWIAEPQTFEYPNTEPDLDDPIGEAIGAWAGVYTSHFHVVLSAFGDNPRDSFMARWFHWIDDTTGNDHLLVTDAGVVYILTDAGDTVERVR